MRDDEKGKRFGSTLGFLITTGIGVVFYLALPLLPSLEAPLYAYGEIRQGIGESAYRQAIWFLLNFTEADFTAGLLSSLFAILGAVAAWRLAARGSRFAGFTICYGAGGLWPWVIAAQTLSLFLSLYVFRYIRLFETGVAWLPTFVVVVSAPAAIVLTYGAGWKTLITASLLPALLGTPTALWLGRAMIPGLGVPAGVALVTAMAVAGFVVCSACRALPWLREAEPPVFPAPKAEDVRSARWSVRRSLADFSDPQFWGNEIVSAGILLGALADWGINRNHGLGGLAGTHLPAVLLSQFLASAVGVFLYAEKFAEKGWYPTYVPVVSVAPFCLLSFGPTVPVAVFAGILGGIIGAPAAEAIGEMLPKKIPGFVANVSAMAACTTLVWAVMSALPWFVPVR